MQSQQPDVFYVMLSWAGPVIGALATIVWALVLSRLKHVESTLKAVEDGLRGSNTDTVYNRLTRAEAAQQRYDSELSSARGAYGELRGEVKGELASIRAGTLSRDIFELRTNDQNDRLEELKQQNRDLENRLARLAQGRGAYESPYPPKRGT